uniref:Immunoglobulin C1-set domain-containing protein n=1 Tax=Hucho hucho TaxID=62062 RepID=A0A4W5PFG8_9TELE
VYRGQHITDIAEDDEAQDGRLLKREKNVVMRKVPPRLRLINKEVSGGFQVSCLAFGFYPPSGRTGSDRGEVLPSGDGTYQLRKSLEVSTEELKKRHHYTCTASHLNLDNKLDVSWESGAERVHLSTLSALLVMVLIVMLLGESCDHVYEVCLLLEWLYSDSIATGSRGAEGAAAPPEK